MVSSSPHYLETFLEMMVAERGASMHTLDAYRRDIRHLLAYLAGKKLSPESVSSDQLRQYMSALSEDGLGARSIARKLSSLRQFFHFLVSEGTREDDPTAKLESPHIGRPLPKYLTEEEVNQLLKAAHEDTSQEGIRTAAMLEMLYASGLRISELISLKVSAVQAYNENNPFLIVFGKGGKERLVPLHTEAMQAIRRYLEIRPHFCRQESPWLFPSKRGKNPITRQRFGQVIKDLARRAGINPSRVSPHVLRHSFASHMLRHGADLRVLQELLGHADLSTTQIYTHLQEDRLHKLIEEKHPLARKQP